MKPSRALILLTLLTALLSAIAAAAGLFSQAETGPAAITSLHGQEVELYARGLYRFESAFRAPIYRGTDAILLFLGVPVLLASLVLAVRGSLRARLLLSGMLTCFLYNAFSLTFGAAYNSLYLLYVACFSASLFAFILAFGTLDLNLLAGRVSPRLPRGWLAGFICFAGLAPLTWVLPIVDALIRGLPAPLTLQHYTSDLTTAIDVAVIVPAAFLTGIFLLRRKPLGTWLITCMLTLLTLIGLVVAGQTVMQLLDGIVLTPGEIAAFVAPYLILALIAAGLLAVFLRHVSDRPA